MNADQVALGAFFVALSCVVAVQTGVTATRAPLSVVALGAVGLSIGSLLVETVTA